MPLVHIYMFTGRTMEQKRAMVKKVTEAICQTAKAKPEAVSIVIHEITRDSSASAGVLDSDLK